jgi:hypothetical protein
MPRITVQAVNRPGEPRRWTLSERIVAENLDSDHYVSQLIERLAWATADAEAQESDPPHRSVRVLHPDRPGRPKSPASSQAGIPRIAAN